MNNATQAAGLQFDHTGPFFRPAVEPDYEGWLIEQAQTLAAAGDHGAITPAMVDALISECRTLSYLHYQRDMADGYLAGEDCPF
jgi:hypothetical protein